MQAGLETATLDSFDQPIDEMIGPPDVTDEPGGGGPATIPQGGPAGQETIVIGPVALELTPIAKRKHRITARRVDGGEIVAVDTVDLGRAAQRKRFIEQILEKLALAEHDDAALDQSLDQRLLEISAAPTAVLQAADDAVAPEAEFSVVDDAQNPQDSGLYWNVEVPPAQICNFDMRITEHVVIRDEGEQETRLRLVIRHRGRERSIEMTAADFTSNGRLRTAIYGAALPGVDLKLGADVLRRAVVAVSDPAIREVTTATGWTDDRSKFLVPGGHVDAHGYHEYDPAQGVAQVDLAGCDNCPVARACVACPMNSSRRSRSTSCTTCSGSTSAAS